MNTYYKRVPARFGPESRFEVRPTPLATLRATEETKLERLKDRLLLQFLEEISESKFNGYVRRAANEAASLAWVTPYPLLVFPALFEEKTDAALHQAERQECVLERSRMLFTV